MRAAAWPCPHVPRPAMVAWELGRGRDGPRRLYACFQIVGRGGRRMIYLDSHAACRQTEGRPRMGLPRMGSLSGLAHRSPTDSTPHHSSDDRSRGVAATSAPSNQRVGAEETAVAGPVRVQSTHAGSAATAGSAVGGPTGPSGRQRARLRTRLFSLDRGGGCFKSGEGCPASHTTRPWGGWASCAGGTRIHHAPRGHCARGG